MKPGRTCNAAPALLRRRASTGCAPRSPMARFPRKVALKLKYGGRPGVAETMARFMARHLAVEEGTLVVPVPLHRWRIWRRGYNQSALIATALARQAGLETRLDLIRRVKRTPPLRGMGPRERRDAVRGAFRVEPAQPGAVKGRHVSAGRRRLYERGDRQCLRGRAQAGGRGADRGALLGPRGEDRRLTSGGPHPHFASEENGMARVEIYTKMFCGYCSSAKRLLAAKGVEVEEYDITLGGPKRAEMLQRASGRSSVPQIFIDDRPCRRLRRSACARRRRQARSDAGGMRIALFQAQTGIDPDANARGSGRTHPRSGRGRRGDPVHARDERPARPGPGARHAPSPPPVRRSGAGRGARGGEGSRDLGPSRLARLAGGRLARSWSIAAS